MLDLLQFIVCCEIDNFLVIDSCLLVIVLKVISSVINFDIDVGGSGVLVFFFNRIMLVVWLQIQVVWVCVLNDWVVVVIVSIDR